mmetsp:Transcript_142408/g.442823  ORF Transcript_142408/g.442823 Transcript_142408/m.442823 type:complete len:420 (-) Transcript_142408:343-1602(-)
MQARTHARTHASKRARTRPICRGSLRGRDGSELEVALPPGPSARSEEPPAPPPYEAEQQQRDTRQEAGRQARPTRAGGRPAQGAADGVERVLLREVLHDQLQQHPSQVLAELEPVQCLPVLGGPLQLRNGAARGRLPRGPWEPQPHPEAAQGLRRRCEHVQLALAEAAPAKRGGRLLHHAHDEVGEGLLDVGLRGQVLPGKVLKNFEESWLEVWEIGLDAPVNVDVQIHRRAGGRPGRPAGVSNHEGVQARGPPALRGRRREGGGTLALQREVQLEALAEEAPQGAGREASQGRQWGGALRQARGGGPGQEHLAASPAQVLAEEPELALSEGLVCVRQLLHDVGAVRLQLSRNVGQVCHVHARLPHGLPRCGAQARPQEGPEHVQELLEARLQLGYEEQQVRSGRSGLRHGPGGAHERE